MNKVCLKVNERLDDLLIKKLKIIQDETEFCFSIDAVLLSHFTTFKNKAKVVDLGTGTGIIPLLLSARGFNEVVGLELNPKTADMAQRSFALNNLSDNLKVLNIDLKEATTYLQANHYDIVTCNPPYWSKDQGKISDNKNIVMARHELTVTLEEIIKTARRLLKYHGRFSMIHLPERLTEIMTLLAKYKIEPKRLQLVQPFINKKPNLIMIEGIVGAKSGLEIMEPFIIYKEDNTYTEMLNQYYMAAVED